MVLSALPAAAGSGRDAQIPAQANQPELSRTTDESLEPTEILVKYRSSSKAAQARARVNAKLVERLPGPALEVLKPAGSLEAAIAALEADPNVVYAEPNYLYKAASVIPNDPNYKMLWAMDKIRMPEAWTATQGSKAVTVAVVDSGMALGHPDLGPAVWRNPGESGSGKESNGIDDDGNGFVDDYRGWDWVGDDNKPADSHGHGSHVAGTVGANGNDGYGIVGVNWRTSLVPLRTLDATGIGNTGDISAAFTYAGRAGIDIVNASLGGSGQSTAVLESITNFPNTLFVVAPGNSGSNNDLEPQYPCNYNLANLICVAASDTGDNLASFSNYGPTSVDLAAPGVSIVSTAPATSQPFTESFETDISSRWNSGGANNLWTRGIDTQGGYLSDSLGVEYLNDTDSWIATTNAFSLKDQSDCKLHFGALVDLETNRDALHVEMSRDAQSWTNVGSWTGSTGGSWKTATDDVSAFDGATSAYLRFRLNTNSTVTAPGADLDDVRVRCLSDVYAGNEFMSASGTSMAAPHVAGVAALLKAAVPDASVGQIVSAILSGTQTTAGLTGKVVTSGRLDAASAIEKLTGTALSQPEPEPTASPSPEPEPTASPSPEPELLAASHERKVSLRLKARKVYGRIRLVDTETGHPGCIANAVVKIKRNGKTIKKLTTSDLGVYSGRIRKQRGRYKAIAPQFDVPDALPAQTCLKAKSPLRTR